MSTQQARNVLNEQIDNLIVKAKEMIKAEGKKKIAELKAQIPTPQELAKKLVTDINGDTCSAKGNEKFMKIYDSLIEKIEAIEKILGNAIETVEGIENEIKPIVEGSGPVKKLEELMDMINPIVQTLNIVIQLAPALLSVFTNQAANATGSDQVQSKRDKAFSKISEYSMLISVVSLMITFYIGEAKKVLIPIHLVLSKLKFIQGEIMKIKLFLFALLLQYTGGCEEWLAGQNNSTVIPPVPPIVELTDLQKHLEFLGQQYEDVKAQLEASGNTQATKRIFEIKQNLEAGYNISFTTVNF